METADNRIFVKKQVAVMNAYKVEIEFSKDGKFFALFRQRLNIL